MINDILSYISVCFSQLIHVLCFKKCLNLKKSKTSVTVSTIMIISFLNIMFNLYLIASLKMVTTLILMIIENKIIFNKKWSETLLGTFYVTIISIILEAILSRIFTLPFNNIESLNNHLVYKQYITYTFTIILYLTFKIKVIRLVGNKVVKEFTQKNYIYLLCLYLIINIMILSSVYAFNYKSKLIFEAVLYCGINIFLFFIIILKLLLNSNERNKKDKLIQSNTEKYERICGDYKELKHNLYNDYISIKSVGNKATKELVDEKLQKLNYSKYDIVSTKDIPYGIQGIIYMKLYNVEQKDINYSINCQIEEKLENKLSAKDYSLLTDVLSILLDNAVEAAEESKLKCIFINIKNDQSYMYINIINNFNTDLNINKIGTKNYSTKNRSSGIGLNYVQKKAKNNYFLTNKIINDLFYMEVKYKLKN